MREYRARWLGQLDWILRIITGCHVRPRTRAMCASILLVHYDRQTGPSEGFIRLDCSSPIRGEDITSMFILVVCSSKPLQQALVLGDGAGVPPPH